MHALLLGKGYSVRYMNPQDYEKYDLIATCNRHVFYPKYMKFLPPRIDREYLLGYSSRIISENYYNDLKIKEVYISTCRPNNEKNYRIINELDSNKKPIASERVPDHVSYYHDWGRHTFQLIQSRWGKSVAPSTGLMALFHLLQDDSIEKIDIVGIDMYAVKYPAYYYDTEDEIMVDKSKYKKSQLNGICQKKFLHSGDSEYKMLFDILKEAIERGKKIKYITVNKKIQSEIEKMTK